MLRVMVAAQNVPNESEEQAEEPAEVATMAQNFGQEDDISVLRIVREVRAVMLTSVEPALAMG